MAMLTWRHDDNYWFGSGAMWWADCGPYLATGLWPPDPPVWIPDSPGFIEVDFYVGLPSTDPAQFGDGTVDTSISDSYRYRSSSGGTEHTASSTTSAGSWPDPDLITPGAHLYVVWYGYSGGPPPTYPPLALVPAAYVRGGYGPTSPPGHWSDWQPAFTYTLPVNPGLDSAVYTGLEINQTDSIPTPDSSSPQSHLNALRDSIYGGGGAAGGFDAQAALFQSDAITGSGEGFDAVGIGYHAIHLTADATAGLDVPPSLPSGATYEYEAGGGTFTGWEDVLFTAYLAAHWQSDLNPAEIETPDLSVFPQPTLAKLTFWACDPLTVTSPGVNVPYNGPRLGYEAGDHLSHADVAVPALPNTSAPTLPDEFYTPFNEATTVAMSHTTRRDLTLVVQPRDADPAGNIPTTATQVYDGTSFRANWTLLAENPADTGTYLGFWKGFTATAVYTAPRWRYFIPETPPYCPPGSRTITKGTPGHWSDWQDPIPVDLAAFPPAPLRRINHGPEEVPTDGTIPSALEAARVLALDPAFGPGYYIGNDGLETFTNVIGERAPAGGFPDFGFVNLAQSTTRFDLTASDGDLTQRDTAPPGLTEGVDYTDIPGEPGVFIDYETETFAFSDWLPWTPTVHAYEIFNPNPPDPAAWPSPPSTIPMDVIGYATPDVLDDTAWQLTPPGTEIGRVTINHTIGDNDHPGIADYSPTFDLSGLPLAWSMVLQNQYFTDPVPGPDFTNSDPGSALLYNWNVVARLILRNAYPDFMTAFCPTGRFLTSRWRYWIPGVTTISCELTAPPLRIGQRNDGLRDGTVRIAANNHASSGQLNPAPRVGGNNTYW